MDLINDALRVGIDGTPLSLKLTGIGRYTYEICKGLDALLPNARFFVYSKQPVVVPTISDRWTYRVDSWRGKKHLKNAAWLKFRAGRLCEEDGVDVFWASGTLLPWFRSAVRTVSTVYDLNYLVAPDSMARPTLWAHRLFFRRDVRKANLVCAISQGTADRLERHLGRKVDAVMPPAVGGSFAVVPQQDIDRTLAALGIGPPYLLALGTLEPRKNLDRLVRAFLDLKQAGAIPGHKLVLVGGKGWRDGALTRLLQESAGRDVLSLGYVSDEHLPALYGGADLFVFPSLYEGFGMPVAEALACGTRVVCTDSPEIREAGGESPVYVAPTVEGIRRGILQALDTTHRPPVLDPRWAWTDSAQVLAKLLARH